MKQWIIDRYNKGQDKWYFHGGKEKCKNRIVINVGDNDNTISGFYDFLFNPKWRWLDTFHKDKEWQQEFWKWMEKKGYGGSAYGFAHCLFTMSGQLGSNKRKRSRQYILEPRKRLLVGYIQEFMEQYR